MAEQARRMNATYSQDIVNSKEWDDSSWMTYFRDRLVKMRAKRAPFDMAWDKYQIQTQADSFYDNDGNLQVNVPMEKTLREIYMGRTKGKVTFEILPDGQTNVDDLQPTKWALNFYLDGNGKDTFWKEMKLAREDKSTLGSAILFTGPRSYSDWNYRVKEGEQIQADTDMLDESKFERYQKKTWFFFPKRIHPKDFFIDDAAYGQPDVQYADDCIFKEKLTASEFNERFGDNQAFKNVENVGYWPDINPKNINDESVDVRRVVVYHYFHRITKKYLVVANESVIIYNGLYLYDDGKLPFVNIQHYSRADRFWGEGIPERVFFLKEYHSNILQDSLDGAAMASGVNLLVGGDDQIGKDWTVGGRQLNLWRTTGGAEKVQNVGTNVNLGYFTAILDRLDRETVTASGINPMSQVETSASTLGQEEMIEANKAVRNASVDENFELGVDDALTMMLSRIKQFGPSLLSEKVYGQDGSVIKYIFPKITVKDRTIEKKDGKTTFVENIGKFGYFDLKPEVIRGVGVKVSTASSNSILPILERQKVNEFMENVQKIGSVVQIDPTGESQKKLLSFLQLDGLLGWMMDAYGYDSSKLKASSAKDKLVTENQDAITRLKSLISNPATTEPAPGTPGGAPAPAGFGAPAVPPPPGQSLSPRVGAPVAAPAGAPAAFAPFK